MNQHCYHENGLSTEAYPLTEWNGSRPEIPPFAKTFIERKARQLVGTCGFRKGDVEDIEQELYLYLLELLPKFDEDKAKLTTFIQRVVEQKAIMLLRERCAKKNATVYASQSLERVVSQNEHDGEVTLGQMLCDKKTLSPELATEVQLAIESLPELPQTVCRMLLDQFSLGEIAEKLGVPRTTLRDVIVRDIWPFYEFLKNS